VVREDNVRCLRPVLQRFRIFKISTNFASWRRFFDDIALVGGFVDENVVFREYIKKYARYESEPKNENGENRSVFAAMRVGASLSPPIM